MKFLPPSDADLSLIMTVKSLFSERNLLGFLCLSYLPWLLDQVVLLVWRWGSGSHPPPGPTELSGLLRPRGGWGWGEAATPGLQNPPPFNPAYLVVLVHFSRNPCPTQATRLKSR